MSLCIQDSEIENFKTPQETILAILQREMNLTIDQLFSVFPDKNFENLESKIYIMVLLNSDVYSNTRSNKVFNEDTSQLIRTTTTVKISLYDIEIFSKNNDAFERHSEIPHALDSFFSQRMQRTNNIGIALDHSSLINTSEFSINNYNIMMNRYRYTYRVNSSFVTTQAVDYYDSIQTPSIYIE